MTNLLPGVSTAQLAVVALKALVLAIVVAMIFGAGVYWEHERMDKVLTKERAEANQFKGGVTALGHDAEVRAAKQRLADIKAKERADEEKDRLLAGNRSTIERMRAAADAARGSLLSTAPADTRCPAGWVCYDAAELERADRERRDALRAIADKGTALILRYSTAVDWAND